MDEYWGERGIEHWVTGTAGVLDVNGKWEPFTHSLSGKRQTEKGRRRID
jgi:hypothetical protein